MKKRRKEKLGEKGEKNRVKKDIKVNVVQDFDNLKKINLEEVVFMDGGFELVFDDEGSVKNKKVATLRRNKEYIEICRYIYSEEKLKSIHYAGFLKGTLFYSDYDKILRKKGL